MTPSHTTHRSTSAIGLACLVAAVPVLALFAAAGCTKQPSGPPEAESTGLPDEPAPAGTADIRGDMTIFIAASLNRCFDSLTTAFEAQYPDVKVLRESGGSRDQCRKITQLQREADIMASADYELIPEMLMPDYADWVIAFARNRVVIAYTDKSKFAREINGDNWYEVLQREGVRYGYADPSKAPVGYRTLILWKLADKHYADRLEGQSIYQKLLAGCPETCVRPDVQELVPLIESMDLDYIFVYRNVALEHNLQFVRLPDEIDLSSEQFADLYAETEVQVAGAKPGETVTKRGTPCLYGVTVLKAAPNRQAATAFVQFMLGPEGMQLIEDCFVEPISPALCASPGLLPPSLQALVEQREDL